MSNPTIVFLAGKGNSTNMLYHALKEEFSIAAIILEEPVGKIAFLKKRLKKLGIRKVTGQVLFQLIAVGILDLISGKRKKEIMLQQGLENSPLPPEKIIRVKSVNDIQTINFLQKISPNLVIVNGTRIISKLVLNCVPADFLNMHAGITPKYRGVHGAYWALVNDDAANCGVTIHLVDPGIDTGAVIQQLPITVTHRDNFVTYPLLQLSTGIPLLKNAMRTQLQNRLIPVANTSQGSLWHHPGLFQYLYFRICKGKK